MKDLLSIDDLDRSGIEELANLAESFLEVTRREIPKVPALRGKTVATLFFEDSTRTRLSFETAAKRLSADTVNLAVAQSSVNKGEGLLDTARTVEAIGADVLVVRHGSAGTPRAIAGWVEASVINAGDGWHEHPTQALVDCFTLRRHRGGSLDGMKVGIVGDVKHSRVARSNVKAFTAMGAKVCLIAPPTLLPPSLDGWPVEISNDLDDVLPELDALYVLRMQQERQHENLVPSMREYAARYGLHAQRAARLSRDAVIMHPGPMLRGIEISPEVAEDPRNLVSEQVANGVPMRMAVLYQLIGSGAPVA